MNHEMMASLYVGDLHPEVTEALLARTFSPAGRIHSIRLCRDWKTSSSLGYAFVNFQQRTEAERAMEMFHFELLMGRPMRVQWSQRDKSLRNSSIGNLFIKNLDKSIDTLALFDTFSAFGKVLSCKVVGYKNGSKGYGYVHFESAEAADLAMNRLNGKLLNERKVFIEHFKSREERKAQEGCWGRKPVYVGEAQQKDECQAYPAHQNRQRMAQNLAVSYTPSQKVEPCPDLLWTAQTIQSQHVQNIPDVVQPAPVHQQTGGTITSTSQAPCLLEECITIITPTPDFTVPSVDTLPTADTLPSLESVPVVETVPPVDSVPAIDTLPAADTLPSLESVPIVETVPPVDSVPAVDTLPAADTLQSLESVSVVETVPPVDSVPAVYTLPAADTLQSLESVPVVQTVPPVDSVPAVDTLPAADTPQSLESVPVVQTVPLVDSVPGVDTLPAADTLQSLESVPIVETVPPVDSVPAIDTLPSLESVPVVQTVPPVDNVPAVDILPAADTLPSQESVPIVGTVPAVDSVPAVDTLPAK